MARLAMRTGTKVMKLAAKSAKKARKPSAAKPKSLRAVRAKHPSTRSVSHNLKKLAVGRAGATRLRWSAEMATGISGVRRFRLFKPAGLQRNDCIPLVVMLHGCGQDAQALAASTRMNRLAQAENFMVLYPEQDRLSNLQNCWNWYDTRSGRAQREADSIAHMINHICLTQPVDPQRVGLVGLSAGAGLVGLLAVRQPERFQAVVMHSGVGPGLASSSVTALRAMRGGRVGVPLAALAAGLHLPALLVIQGSADTIVAPSNGTKVVQQWADLEGAHAGHPRTVQRGKRHATVITDYRSCGRQVATLCVVKGLGHAWSGGATGMAYSDPMGPDASRMAWAFMRKQFARHIR